MDDSSPIMGDCSDMSVNSEYLNTSVSSDDQQQHVKPLKIKINSPAVTPKMEKMLGVGKSVTIINSPQQLSRASSSMSLASATNSMAAEEVRSFSNNYEQLLQQATVSIRRLTKDKAGLEAEQDRLLNVNIDLATEVKRLLALDKENKAERKVSYDLVNSTCMISTPGWSVFSKSEAKRCETVIPSGSHHEAASPECSDTQQLHIGHT